MEDDHAVRSISCNALRELGYSVVEAESAPEALRILRGEKFDLLFTDIVMSGVNGLELSEKARAIDPALKVLFTSGFAKDIMTWQGSMDLLRKLIYKPFRIYELALKMREYLASSQ